MFNKAEKELSVQISEKQWLKKNIMKCFTFNLAYICQKCCISDKGKYPVWSLSDIQSNLSWGSNHSSINVSFKKKSTFISFTDVRPPQVLPAELTTCRNGSYRQQEKKHDISKSIDVKLNEAVVIKEKKRLHQKSQHWGDKKDDDQQLSRLLRAVMKTFQPHRRRWWQQIWRPEQKKTTKKKWGAEERESLTRHQNAEP